MRLVGLRRLAALLVFISCACVAHAQRLSTLTPQIPPPISVSCDQRSICGELASPSATSSPHPAHHPHHPTTFERNCFCDDLCTVYDDCCSDFRSSDSSTLSLPYHVPRTVVTCQRMPNSESGRSNSEMYVVTRCHPDYDDVHVKERCEKPASSSTGYHDDRFYRLPVRGGPPLNLLYRNAYCAICAGDQALLTFWRAVLRCNDFPMTGRTNSSGSLASGSLFRNLPKAGCTTAFLPSRESLSLPVPRACKVNIGRCDRSWSNRTVARMCRERTDYVYAGNRAFRNRACAVCNYVNETYIRCEDGRSSPPVDVDGNYRVVLEENVPIVVELDFNARKALLSAEEDSDRKFDGVTRLTVAFPDCPDGKLYNPFVDECRLLFCRQGSVLRDGNCVALSRQETRSPSEVDSADTNGIGWSTGDDYDEDDYVVNPSEVTTDIASSAPSTHVTSASIQCPLVPVNQTDYKPLGNGSVYVISLRRVFRTSHVVWRGGSLLVCVRQEEGSRDVTGADVTAAFLSPRYNFTMFQFERSQRSVSLVGAIVCLVALFVHLLVYAMFTSLWTNTDGKCVLCLAASLFFAQLLYLFVILVWDDFPGSTVCFVVSQAMQYCFLAAFCWLNVISIDVFRWLRSSEASSASTYSYIAEECCTRFVWYSLYAWTVPFIVVSGSVATAVLRIDGWHPYEPRLAGCWAMGLSQLMLFTLPICLLLTANLILYVVAACRLCFETLPTRFQHHRIKYKHRIIVSMQLSILMGAAWLLAVVAVVSGWTFLWYLFVLFDTLQGLFVCAAFVCTRKVWRLFCNKGRVRRLSEAAGSRQSAINSSRGNGGAKGAASSRGKLSPRDANNRVIMLETSI